MARGEPRLPRGYPIMPKSRGRKPQKPSRQAPTPATPLPVAQDQRSPTLVKRISEQPLIVLAGVALIIAGMIGLVYDAVRPTEISAAPIPDSSQPFAFLFTVKNESWLFDMRETVRWTKVSSRTVVTRQSPPAIAAFFGVASILGHCRRPM